MYNTIFYLTKYLVVVSHFGQNEHDLVTLIIKLITILVVKKTWFYCNVLNFFWNILGSTYQPFFCSMFLLLNVVDY